MKKAIILVSFGTGQTGPSGLHTLADLAAQRWPEHLICLAYTSAVIRRRMAAQGLNAQSLSEVLKQLDDEAFDDVRICPVLLSYGNEYEKILQEAKTACAQFAQVVLSTPLLAEPVNRQAMAHILSARFPVAEQGSGYLLVGHGTQLEGNRCYQQVEDILHQMGRRDIQVALLVGQPGVGAAIAVLKQKRITRATVVPLLLTAGKHAMEDLAGDAPDSCRNRLALEGMQVSCIMTGLMEYPEVVQLYLKHFESGFVV